VARFTARHADEPAWQRLEEQWTAVGTGAKEIALLDLLRRNPAEKSSSDQTTREGQAELSRVPSGRANHCGIRGQTHDPQGAGAVGQRQ